VIEMIIVGLVNLIPMLIEGFIQMALGVASAAASIWESVKQAFVNIFKGIWNAITNIFSNVAGWFGEKFTGAKDAVLNAWKGVKNFFGDIWDGITNVFSGVKNFFKDAFTGAWNAVKNVFSGVRSFFIGIWNDIKDVFSDLGTKIADSISGAVRKGINGLIGSAENIINGFFKLVNGAIGLINEIPGVDIPTIKLVEFTRLAKGGVVDKPTPAVFGEDGAEAVVPLENNTGWLNKVALKLHEFSLQYKGGLDNSLSIRSVELHQLQVSELQTLNITANKILSAVLAMDENMGGHMREALDGVSLDVNQREFARLVRGTV
jgi:hypothetical protein